MYDLANKQAFDALSKSKKIGSLFLEMKAYEALTSVYQMNNELTKSINYLRKGFEITKKECPIELHLRYANLAVCELQQNNPTLAKVYLDSAKLFAKNANQLSFIYLMYGQYFAQIGDITAGKSSILKSRELYIQNSNLARVADCDFFPGDLYMEQKKYALAKNSYQLFINYNESINNAEQKFGGYQALSALYEKIGDYKSAFKFANKCVYIQDTLFADRKIRESKSQEIKFETSIKEQKIKEQENLLSLNKKKTDLILLSSILGIISISSFFFYLRNIAKRKSLQTEKEKIDYQLDSIRGKILPHFSGNILNAITYLFESNQADAGIAYLTKYTELNKDILLSSENPSRSLKEELNFLNSYLSLEKLRYQDNLQFELNVDNNVNLETHIPVLILHTFCENAIRHGIMSIKGKGKLDVNIKEIAGGILQIKIIDDGIGLEEAKRNNIKSTGQGLEILSKQIDLYNKNNSFKISFSLSEIENDNKVVGTQVLINIPHHFNYSA